MTADKSGREEGVHTTKDEAELTHVTTMADDEKNGKPEPDNEARDYTGTAKKTDPREIRLVRKLDLCIMVRTDCSAPTDDGFFFNCFFG